MYKRQVRADLRQREEVRLDVEKDVSRAEEVEAPVLLPPELVALPELEPAAEPGVVVEEERDASRERNSAGGERRAPFPGSPRTGTGDRKQEKERGRDGREDKGHAAAHEERERRAASYGPAGPPSRVLELSLIHI